MKSIVALFALAISCQTALAQEVAPLEPSAIAPPDGQAYVVETSAPGLLLVTSAGRWLIALDPTSCDLSSVQPDTDVLVSSTVDGLTIVQPMLLGDVGPDPTYTCLVQQPSYFADPTPCAQLDGLCTVAAERWEVPQ